jgi:flavin reductase (DIM6/NTAB) family NADH-FMN oxidoreductase RutF
MGSDPRGELDARVDAELEGLRQGQGLYRELLSRYPAGVCVVTAFEEGRQPRGLTLIAFCGVSLDPPLVLVCVDRGSNTLPAIRRSGGFTVNLLAADASSLALRMATKSELKFNGVDWLEPELPEAGPVLRESAVMHVLCHTVREVEAGDHVVFIGEVKGGAVARDQRPLLYHRRGFFELRDIDGSS